MDEIQSTDVGGSPSANVSESTEAAAPSVSTEESVSQAPASGDVTAQPAAQSEQVQEGEATPPPIEDPLEGIPSVDELQAQVQQKVPYSEALLRLRTALEARNEELGSLKPLESLKDITQLGEPETIKSVVETHKLLFTPVVNPQTQQVEKDEHGFDRITTAPFIEKVDGENPGMAEQMLYDALNYTPDRGDGKKVALGYSPEVQAALLSAWGLDPQRLNDYRNIDALSQPTGEITTEELDAIPEQFRETYKQLPPGVRDDLMKQDETTRQFNLEAHKERFDRKVADQQALQEREKTQQAQQAQLVERVRVEQDNYVNQQLREGHASIMDDVAKQVNFSADPQENSRMLGITGAFLFALRDPEFAPIAETLLPTFGTKLDPSFHQALADADKHLRDAKAFELFGQQGRAQDSRTKANNARTQVMAKLAPLALTVAKALGGQIAQRATTRNGLLTQATSVRPVPDGGTQAEQNGYLPPGMLPNDPRAGVEIARRTGLLG